MDESDGTCYTISPCRELDFDAIVGTIDEEDKSLSNLCGFDLATIRDHCLCPKCKEFFKDRSQSDLLSLFQTCLGCPIREQPVLEESYETIPSESSEKAQGTDEINDDHLICGIGKYDGNRHYMKDPRVLPCFHNFCCECLKQEVQHQAQNMSLEVSDDDAQEQLAIPFTCPVNGCCSKAVSVTREGDVLTCKTESGLLKSIVERYAFERRMIDGEELCDIEKEVAIAECVDCIDEETDSMSPLCEKCLDTHRLGRGTKNHRVIRVEDLKHLSERRFSHYKAPRCDTHHDCRLCMYCPMHETVVCMKCARESGHESCRNMFDVEAHYDDERTRPHKDEFEKVKEQVQSLHNSFKVAAKYIELKVQKLTEHCHAITAEINNRSKALKEEIETQRRCLVFQTAKIHTLKLDDFQTHLKRLQKLEEEVGDSLQWIQNFQKFATPVDFFLFKQKMEGRMRSLLEYRMHYQEDNLLMNEIIHHKIPWSFESMNGKFRPFCVQGFGHVYSTPCLKKFTVESGRPFTLVCRDIYGTALHAHLPDIEAKLEFQSGDTPVTSIECFVVKHRKKGVYKFKIKADIESGRYCLLISNKNPVAFFDYEEHGKKFEFQFSCEHGFQQVV